MLPHPVADPFDESFFLKDSAGITLLLLLRVSPTPHLSLLFLSLFDLVKGFNLLVGSPKFKHWLLLNIPPWSRTPAGGSMHSPCVAFRAYPCWLQALRRLGLLALIISGLNPFACAMDECYLPSGFIRFVTSSYAEFSSDLVVSLWSGWIYNYRANLPVLTSLGTPKNNRRSVMGCILIMTGVKPGALRSCSSIAGSI